MVPPVTGPTILAFDTSAPACAAALLHNGMVTTRVDEMAKGQAEHLIPMLEEMLSTAGLHWADLDGIGVGIGPGNFTGIRIAVSAARGLALGLGKTAVGVSTLDALSIDQPNAIACLSAPRDRAYIQANGIAALCNLTPDDMPPYQPKSEPVLIGNAAEAVANLIPLQTSEPKMPMITAIAHLAARRLHSTTQPPCPLYLRAADAAPARDAPPVILP